jgi:peptidoglycan/xylan/chitin deacetylase (PgdA/CDA1 family)
LIKGLIDSDLHKPIPIAVSVTGKWMEAHPNDFKALLAHQQKGELDVTFVNHSYNHEYDKYQPDNSKNFLLTKGVDFASEILRVEWALLERGITPSVYFRFPGLVSDERLIIGLRGFGLIPIGSDAWLAKGQKPTGGSIILVHGNGKEPAGVTKFLNNYMDSVGNLYSLDDAFGLPDDPIPFR